MQVKKKKKKIVEGFQSITSFKSKKFCELRILGFKKKNL